MDNWINVCIWVVCFLGGVYALVVAGPIFAVFGYFLYSLATG